MDPHSAGVHQAEDLAARRLETVTLNAFPYGGFHREVVKKDVYRPDWAWRTPWPTAARDTARRALGELAGALAELDRETGHPIRAGFEPDPGGVVENRSSSRASTTCRPPWPGAWTPPPPGGCTSTPRCTPIPNRRCAGWHPNWTGPATGSRNSA
ncbi:hypothetical protein ACWCPF_18715 [Streptomyces sp. NPDC001858]